MVAKQPLWLPVFPITSLLDIRLEHLLSGIKYENPGSLQRAGGITFCVACHLKWKDRKCKDTTCFDALLVDLALKDVSGSKVVLVYFGKMC